MFRCHFNQNFISFTCIGVKKLRKKMHWAFICSFSRLQFFLPHSFFCNNFCSMWQPEKKIDLVFFQHLYQQSKSCRHPVMHINEKQPLANFHWPNWSQLVIFFWHIFISNILGIISFSHDHSSVTCFCDTFIYTGTWQQVRKCLLQHWYELGILEEGMDCKEHYWFVTE